MKKAFTLLLILFFAFFYCGKRIKLPTNLPQSGAGIADTTYVPVSPEWTAANGIPFNHPEDVHVGIDGYVYIADTGNDRIVKLDQGGNFVSQYAGIKHPQSISQDRLLRLIATGGNTIYVKLADKMNFDSIYTGRDIYDSIMVVRPDTIIDTTIISPDSLQIDTLMGLLDTTYLVDTVTTNFKAIAADPRAASSYAIYFVCDYTRSQILHFLFREPNEFYSLGDAVPTGYNLGETWLPTGIFTYLSGDKFRLLFCQQLYYYSVQLLDGDNFAPLIPRTDSSQIYWQGTFGLAEDVTVDEYENILVVDSQENKVHKFSQNGVPILSFGKEGTGEMEFNNPKGIAYGNKTLYVADTDNNRILRFMLSKDYPH